MHVSVYRCREAYLLVPTCFLPSMEATAVHGPARYRGTMRISGAIVDALVASMDAKAYVTLALDHPMTRSPEFPCALVAVGSELGGIERRRSVKVQVLGPFGHMAMQEPNERRGGDVTADRRGHFAHRSA
ncbi:hypothetical protein [Cognatiluteimonas profundi]|uniref:hypothetical protein n=1 Tax=Cognatiluteimonas profundi TaxID=2594501 RepID=UPI00131A9C1A|nr:hypothetical protein [Lysobacter profundi]